VKVIFIVFSFFIFLSAEDTILTPHEQLVFKTVSNVDGYIDEDLYNEFWKDLRVRVKKDEIAKLKQSLPELQKNQMLIWQCVRTTTITKKRCKSDKVERILKEMYDSGDFISYNNTMGVLEAAEKGTGMILMGKTIYITTEKADEVIAGLDASMKRIDRLLSDNWSPLLKSSKKEMIAQLNKKTNSKIALMKERWQEKKELICSFAIGTERKDIEAIMGMNLGKSNASSFSICPDDDILKNVYSVKCLNFKFYKNMLSERDNNCRETRGDAERTYSFLSEKVSTERESKVLSNIKDAYGDSFEELSLGEQEYILKNQEVMRRITQQVLNRVGRVNIPRDMRVNSSNIVEFYLYPNGEISEIKFIDKSNFYILDDTTKETIEYAYNKYPRPDQKTRIRYKVGYYLRGY